MLPANPLAQLSAHLSAHFPARLPGIPKLDGFPAPLARLVGAMPSLPVSAVFVALFNRLAWRVLKDLDWSTVQGKRFCVHVRDLGLKSYFSLGPAGLRPEMADHADVTFTATARDFTHLALRLEDPDTLFFNRRLLIEGNTDVGLTVKNMLDAIEFDALLAALPVPLARAVGAMRAKLAQEQAASAA